MASLCRFPKKSGKNQGIHCRFACFASKKIKNDLHFFSLIKRKFLFNHDTIENSKKAFEWAEANTIPYVDALNKLDIKGEVVGLDNDSIIEGRKLEARSSVKMGGSGHIHLLYDCTRLLKVKNVIETGVAYGWSSLAILKALYQKCLNKYFFWIHNVIWIKLIFYFFH